MKSFETRLQEDRRQLLLQLLHEQNSYRANVSQLRSGLHALGITISLDLAATDIAWLQEQRLLTTEEPVPGVVVAMLTARGQDVVTGATVVPGVSKPSLR